MIWITSDKRTATYTYKIDIKIYDGSTRICGIQSKWDSSSWEKKEKRNLAYREKLHSNESHTEDGTLTLKYVLKYFALL